MNAKEKMTYETTYNDISEELGLLRTCKVSKDADLEEGELEKFNTKQQQCRDEAVTKLLNAYVNYYERKFKRNNVYRWVVTVFSFIVLVAVFFICFKLINWITADSVTTMDVKTYVALLTTMSGTVVAVVAVIKIIAEYVFPKEEEKYITEIVQIIQNNDLENKRENIRAFYESLRRNQ